MREAAAAALDWKVMTIKRPGLTRDLPPGKEDFMWVANSSTLVLGKEDAVLVDTFLITEQSQGLLEWVVASGRNLTSIYVTHGHADHFFGLAPLLERFPGGKSDRDTRRCRGHAGDPYAGVPRWLLAEAFPRPDPRPPSRG